MLEKSLSTQRKKSWGVRTITLLAIALVGGLFLMVLVAPPLIPSNAYKVAYSVNGVGYHDAELYRPFAFRPTCYIFLPHVEPPFSWVGIDWRRGVADMPLLFQEPLFGWACIHCDTEFGVRLTDSKIGIPWKADFANDGVVLAGQFNSLSQQQISVNVSKN